MAKVLHERLTTLWQVRSMDGSGNLLNFIGRHIEEKDLLERARRDATDCIDRLIQSLPATTPSKLDHIKRD